MDTLQSLVYDLLIFSSDIPHWTIDDSNETWPSQVQKKEFVDMGQEAPFTNNA